MYGFVHFLTLGGFMKFTVEDKVFETLDTVCFAVVVAHEADNTVHNLKIQQLLEENILLC
jgi:hypothetical protein